MNRALLPFAPAIAALLGGCGASLAPSVHSGNYVAPGRLEGGQIEVGTAATFGLPHAYPVAGATVGVALTDHVEVEVGGEYLYDLWALGSLGLRLTTGRLDAGDTVGTRWALDVEVGGGAGAGGLCGSDREGAGEYGPACEDDPEAEARDWTDRVAGGGYFGLGAGLTWSWFSLFARWRLQVTDAADVPETLWLTAVAGVEFELDCGLRLDVSGGWARFTNLASEADGGAVEAGLSYEFDAF